MLFSSITAFFDSRYSPVILAADRQPPQGLKRFILYFVRQFRTAYFVRMAMVAIGSVVDAMMPIFVGLIVGMLTTTRQGEIFTQHGSTLLLMAVLIVVVRPVQRRSRNAELPALIAVAAVLFTIE